MPHPIFYKGEQVGEWRHFDERLTMFLLRTPRKERFSRWVELGPPDPEDPDADSALALDGGIERIEWHREHDLPPEAHEGPSDVADAASNHGSDEGDQCA
ncbi:MAG: hypothetical protein M3Q52_10845 [Pseudomonadota bacterium]|nr:hypothetical protein [Pseudomonadota bacterium]